jgi:hypothetical protein
MGYERHRRRLRFTAHVVIVAILSLTCTPICGSALDVDSVSCCERHRCIPAGHGGGPAAGNIMHAGMTPPLSASIGFDAQSCCREGELTYPTSQVPASTVHDFALQAAVGFILPVAQLPSQFSEETANRLFTPSPPTPLYTLHATFRI